MDLHTTERQNESEKVQNCAARFVIRNYVYETGSMIGIHGRLKWISLKKRRWIIDSIRYIKIYNVKPGYLHVHVHMTLFPRVGAAEISTLWHFRHPLQVQNTFKCNFFPQIIGEWYDLPDSLISHAWIQRCVCGGGGGGGVRTPSNF